MSNKTTGLRNLKVLLSVSIMLSVYACTSTNINSIPGNISDFKGTLNSPVTNQPVLNPSEPGSSQRFNRSGIIMNNNGSYAFIADCARQSGFKVTGNIEGQPCESDSFAGMDKFYLPPEYNKTKAVMVSEYITEISGGTNILNAILEAGSDIWYFTSNTNQLTSVNSFLNTKSANKILNLDITSDTVWARDWAPLMSEPAQDYKGEKVDLKMLDTNYFNTRPLDDSISRQIKNDRNSLSLNLKRTSLPVYMEGGNIMCNEKNCFLTSKVITENSEVIQNNDIILNEEQIKEEFKKQVEQDIWFVPMMPYESTEHIDMWAKFLNNDTLLIASLSDETLKASSSKNYSKFKEVQEFLEMQATGTDKSGKTVLNSLAYLVKSQNPSVKIIRVPMPVPVIHKVTDSEETIEIFRSYTNSLLVNGYALVPQYSTDIYTELPYNDNSLKQKYENEVESTYQQAGYKVIWIPSDYLIGIGGAVHCVTMQVPL